MVGYCPLGDGAVVLTLARMVCGKPFIDFSRVKALARMVCGLKSYLCNALKKEGALVLKGLPFVVGLPPLEMSNFNR